MNQSRDPKSKVDFARERRRNKTVSEGLLWSALRAKQFCGLKFRREHPIGMFVVDFACVSKHFVVEIDGEYHDHVIESDLKRQESLEAAGWKVLRISAADVESNLEAVLCSIASALDIEFSFVRNGGTGSGMKNKRSGKLANRSGDQKAIQDEPSPRLGSTLPEGE